VLGRELSIEILKAMGCPIELCQSVSIDMRVDELVSLEIRYALNPEWLEAAAKALAEANHT
jgi:hypothetical protein